MTVDEWRSLPFKEKLKQSNFLGVGHFLNKGGRVKRDNGGIMNLGGMEKDYRNYWWLCSYWSL